MRRMFVGGLFAAGAFSPESSTAAGVADHPLIGTWRVTSAWTSTVGVEGEKAQPKVGYLIFTPEHRIVAVVADPGRKPATNDAEALALARSMVTYTGKIDLKPDHYTIDLELSSSMLTLDQKQTRYYQIEGDNLKITMPIHDSTVRPGVRTSTVLTAVRER